jgi:membrane protease YdiL (CAAX protease family)
MRKKQIFILIILSALGLVVWILISELSGIVEAWDSLYYYIIGLPIMFVAAGFAGYFAPSNCWKWGIAVVILQPVALFTKSKPDPLMIVGLLFFIFFILLSIGSAYLGKRLREN